jgi:hypothetical protein
MIARARFIGRLAGTTQIIFGVLLGGVASFSFEPGFISRGAVLASLYALPGVIGLIGVTARRPSLLLAAALTAFVGAFIAFSGVTLIFLVPALLFLLAAGLLALTARPADFGASLGGLGRLGLSAVIVVLLVGAGASVLLVTDSGCWSEYPTPAGIRIEVGPFSTGEMQVPSGAVMTECSTGLLTLRGVGAGALLGTGAIGVALVVARRRDSGG